MTLTRRTFATGSVALSAVVVSGARASAANEIVIGLSNGYFGTEYRNQMIAGAERPSSDA